MLTTHSRRGRTAKACSQCRTAKTRCNFADGAASCDKCLQRGIQCTLVHKHSNEDTSNDADQMSSSCDIKNKPLSNVQDKCQIPIFTAKPNSDQISSSYKKTGVKKINKINKTKRGRTSLSLSTFSTSEPNVHLLSPTDLANSALTNPLDIHNLPQKDEENGLLVLDHYDISMHMRSPTSQHSNEGLSPVIAEELCSRYSPDNNYGTTDHELMHKTVSEDNPLTSDRNIISVSNSFSDPDQSQITMNNTADFHDGTANEPVFYQDNSSIQNDASVVSTNNLKEIGNTSFLQNLDLPRTRHLSFEDIDTKAPPLSEHKSRHPRTLSTTDMSSLQPKEFASNTLENHFLQLHDQCSNDNLSYYLTDSHDNSDCYLNLGVLSDHENENENGVLSQDVAQTIEKSNNIDTPFFKLENKFEKCPDFLNHNTLNLNIHEDNSPPTTIPASNFHKFQNSIAHMALQAVGPILQERMGSISRLMNASRHRRSHNVVSNKILTHNQVVKLFRLFKGNYDHWISLPDADPNLLVDHLLTQCPLLVTACCCVALRFGTVELWQTVYPRLVKYLNYELSQLMSNCMPQNIESIQALTILAKYADTLSYNEYVFDMWHISGLGLQQFENVASIQNHFSYVHMRLWNHLVLTHISSANLTGRNPIVNDRSVKRCLNILEQQKCTQFDRCLLAEISIQWQLTQYLTNQINYGQFMDQTRAWEAEWGGLSNLSMIQFVRPCVLFCKFIARLTHFKRVQKNYGEQKNEVECQNGFNISLPTNIYTKDLVDGLDSLLDILNQLLTTVQPVYFVCLSDSIHNLAFIAGVMAMVSCKILVNREPISDSLQKRVAYAQKLVVQIAYRFRDTSRGQDIAQTQHVSLLQLTKSREIQLFTQGVQNL